MHGGYIFELKMTKLIVLMLLAIFFVCATTSDNEQFCARPSSYKKRLLMILIDGFRSDYLEAEYSGFNKVIHEGVMVDNLIPAFPSVSYTNYYSIMTGNNYTNLYIHYS